MAASTADRGADADGVHRGSADCGSDDDRNDGASGGGVAATPSRKLPYTPFAGEFGADRRYFLQ